MQAVNASLAEEDARRWQPARKDHSQRGEILGSNSAANVQQKGAEVSVDQTAERQSKRSTSTISPPRATAYKSQ